MIRRPSGDCENFANGGVAEHVPMVASVLHAADPEWRPDAFTARTFRVHSCPMRFGRGLICARPT